MRRAPILAGSVLLASCVSPSLVLLPDEQGQTGAVAVLETNGRPTDQVINRSESRTRLGESSLRSRPLGPKGLNKQEAALLTALPPPARSFLLYFRLGTIELVPDSTVTLSALRGEIAARSGPEVEVIGHTDTVGSQEDNDQLSLKRAEEVVTWLTAQGFDRSQMSSVGRGERDPKEATADNVSSPANRRVEVIVR